MISNVYFWTKHNPHIFKELENNLPYTVISAAISAKHLFGQYFFVGPVNQGTYLSMLRKWFMPQLEKSG
jgi:hypothetical protein